MSDPKTNQRMDDEWIGKPHPVEPDEIGKAPDPVELQDDDKDDDGDKSVQSADVDVDDDAKASDGKRPSNPTK